MSGNGKGDAEKTRYWQRTISKAARSGATGFFTELTKAGGPKPC
jgi:hypothetical protein